LFSFKVEMDRESIKHKKSFLYTNEFSCQGDRQKKEATSIETTSF